MPKSLIVTGSDPNGIAGYGPEADEKNRELRNALSQYYRDNGITDVYTTMGLGSEQIAAEAAINVGVNFHALIPYNNQASRWPQATRERYEKILSYAQDKTQIDGDFSRESGGKRTEFLTNLVRSEQAGVITIFNGDESIKGASTVLYNHNMLRKASKDSGTGYPLFLNPNNMQFSEKKPFPDRPRIVSQDLLDKIVNQNNDKPRKGIYSLEERMHMSDVWNIVFSDLAPELSPELIQNLRNRGFSDDIIRAEGYVQLPRTDDEVKGIISGLEQDGYTPEDLMKVIGFAAAEDGGEIFVRKMKASMYIPVVNDAVLDKNGKPLKLGSQVMVTDAGEKALFGKYIWTSAGGSGIGLSSGQITAFRKAKEPVTLLDNKNGPTSNSILMEDSIWVTEGPLKGRLAQHALGDQVTMMACPGVWAKRSLKQYVNGDFGPNVFEGKNVLLAFDSDSATNENVRAAMTESIEFMLDNGAKSVMSIRWDKFAMEHGIKDHKGIDDFATACNRLGINPEFEVVEVFMHDATTKVQKNEYGTRNITVREGVPLEKSPYAGSKFVFDMGAIHESGHKIPRFQLDDIAIMDDKKAIVTSIWPDGYSVQFDENQTTKVKFDDLTPVKDDFVPKKGEKILVNNNGVQTKAKITKATAIGNEVVYDIEVSDETSLHGVKIDMLAPVLEEEPQVKQKRHKDETPEQRRVRKLDEHSGRHEPVFQQTLQIPDERTADTYGYVNGGGKFIVRDMSNSGIISQLQKRKDEIPCDIDEAFGRPENAKPLYEVLVTDEVSLGTQQKACAVIFAPTNQNVKHPKVDMLIKGSIINMFKEGPDIDSHTFVLSNLELESARQSYGQKQDSRILDPRKNMTQTVSLDTTMMRQANDLQNDGITNDEPNCP